MSPAGGQQTQEQLVDHATCLGCGCACDDIAVVVRDGRIAEARNTCTLGARWFGDGLVPGAIRVSARDASLDEAVSAIAAMLSTAAAPLVYLAPELSCEAQRHAVALADLLHASLDTVTSGTALGSILAAQERGRAGATLGEIRNRADVIVFWGVDPAVRYPRYGSRYAPEPSGLQIANGRSSRTVIAVDIGTARGPEDADVRVAVPPSEDVATLTALDAVLRKPGLVADGPLWTRARELAAHVTKGRYVAVVADAEPAGPRALLQLQRAAALIAVTQALNGPTRCALSTLRGGGNRTGAESVLTAQTGYPTGVSFARGFPVYQPHDLVSAADAILIVGDPAQASATVTEAVANVPTAVIGPRASLQTTARVAIDTGIAGIHTGGTALRMDDVALPLRPSLTGAVDAVDVLKRLTARIQSDRRVGPSGPPPSEARSSR